MQIIEYLDEMDEFFEKHEKINARWYRKHRKTFIY